MSYDFEFGSKTAKGGFASEKQIASKFNNWKNDTEAKEWLNILGYNIEEIKELKAIQIPPNIDDNFARQLGLENEEDKQYKKADVQIQITIILENDIIKRENISIKKANLSSNFNQVDKRKIDTYRQMWKFDDEITEMLKLFTGELEPINNISLLKKYCDIDYDELEDDRRIYLNYLKDSYLKKLINFFSVNKALILLDIIKGRGALSAEWLMVVKYDESKDLTTWLLVNINQAINIFSIGEVKLTKRNKASLQLSNGITMQRKGGTPDPTSLQFKIKPLMVFDVNLNKVNQQS